MLSRNADPIVDTLIIFGGVFFLLGVGFLGQGTEADEIARNRQGHDEFVIIGSTRSIETIVGAVFFILGLSLLISAFVVWLIRRIRTKRLERQALIDEMNEPDEITSDQIRDSIFKGNRNDTVNHEPMEFNRSTIASHLVHSRQDSKLKTVMENGGFVDSVEITNPSSYNIPSSSYRLSDEPIISKL